MKPFYLDPDIILTRERLCDRPTLLARAAAALTTRLDAMPEPTEILCAIKRREKLCDAFLIEPTQQAMLYLPQGVIESLQRPLSLLATLAADPDANASSEPEETTQKFVKFRLMFLILFPSADDSALSLRLLRAAPRVLFKHYGALVQAHSEEEIRALLKGSAPPPHEAKAA